MNKVEQRSRAKNTAIALLYLIEELGFEEVMEAIRPSIRDKKLPNTPSDYQFTPGEERVIEVNGFGPYELLGC